VVRGRGRLTSFVYFICVQWLHLSLWPATLIAFAIGFGFRVAARWFKCEELMPRLPSDLFQWKTVRESLKEEMQPARNWKTTSIRAESARGHSEWRRYAN
jgi:hypothetical protein